MHQGHHVKCAPFGHQSQTGHPLTKKKTGGGGGKRKKGGERHFGILKAHRSGFPLKAKRAEIQTAGGFQPKDGAQGWPEEVRAKEGVSIYGAPVPAGAGDRFEDPETAERRRPKCWNAVQNCACSLHCPKGHGPSNAHPDPPMQNPDQFVRGP